MARIARNSITTPYLHVMTQGIEKRKIFIRDADKKKYLELLKENFKNVKKTYLLAYCIMDNHVHLLIYTEDIEELSLIMQNTDTSYGMFYNKSRERVGYVFRDRFKIQPIDSKDYLHTALVYIHKNPLKAGIVKELNEYKFSSYNSFIYGRTDKRKIELLMFSINYKEEFILIHRRKCNFKMVDVKEYVSKSYLEVCLKDFLEKNGISKTELQNNNYFLIKFVSELEEQCDFMQKDIAEVIEIGKNRILNIQKKKED